MQFPVTDSLVTDPCTLYPDVPSVLPGTEWSLCYFQVPLKTLRGILFFPVSYDPMFLLLSPLFKLSESLIWKFWYQVRERNREEVYYSLIWTLITDVKCRLTLTLRSLVTRV